MILPSGFQDTIGDVFYDKLIKILNVTDGVDNEGWADVITTTEEGSFYGNLRFTNMKDIQEDYGIAQEFDVAITTDEDVELDSILEYDSVTYRVTDSLPFDSHNLILAEKWLSKSTTSISA